MHRHRPVDGRQAWGPWVGTLLEERGFPGVVGTLRRPCDALSLPKLVRELPRDRRIVAIDACLGREESVGAYLVKKGPIVPARSVNGGFGGVGDYSVAGVVNANGPKPYWTLQSTSLYRVMEMAKEMAAAIASQWPDRIVERRERMLKISLSTGIERPARWREPERRSFCFTASAEAVSIGRKRFRCWPRTVKSSRSI